MESNKEFLGTEPIGKLLFRLSVPTVVAQLINMLYNIVDRIYIGHMPGDGSLALTGIGVCMPLIMLVAAFAALVSAGGAPRASIFMGKRDHEAAEKTLGNCFGLQVIVSVILTAVLLIWNEELLLAFGASENTIVYAWDYMKIYAMGTIFVQLTLGLNAFISTQGFASISMRTTLIGAIMNIILDPIFIFVFDMGVSGAALATILSQAISCIWVLSFLCGKKTLLKLKVQNMKLNPEIFLPCIALGLAPFIMQFTESILSVSFNTSLLEYGGDIAVGAMTILSSVMQFSMLPLHGLTQGAQPIISYNYGANDLNRVKQAFTYLLTSCLIYSTTLWAICMFMPQVFINIFTSKTELIEYSVIALRIYMATSCLFGAQIACQQTFIALGNAKTSLFLALLRKVFLLIPLIYILPNFMANKDIAVFLAEPIADTIAVCTTVTLFLISFKKILKASKN